MGALSVLRRSRRAPAGAYPRRRDVPTDAPVDHAVPEGTARRRPSAAGGAVMGSASVWLNGTLVDVEQARLSPFDHGILVGDGVFETLAVYRGVPFAWRRHHDRLRRSADGLGLGVPPSEDLRSAADAAVAANGGGDGRLRITVTGGPSPPGSARGDAAPTALVPPAAARPPPAAPDLA